MREKLVKLGMTIHGIDKDLAKMHQSVLEEVSQCGLYESQIHNSVAVIRDICLHLLSGSDCAQLMVRPVNNYDHLTSSLEILNRLEINSSKYRNVNCSNDEDLFNNKKFLIIKIQRIIVRYLET